MNRCVATTAYRRARVRACREYARLTGARVALEERIDQLLEAIGTLTKLCGLTPSVPWGITDACRTVLRNAARPMTPVDVRNRLASIGFDLARYSNDLSAIHTVLKRLNQSGELRFVPRAPGKHAYEWNRGYPVVMMPHTEPKEP